MKRNAENGEDAEGDAENFEGGRADPARSADFWLWRADLIVASSLGNEEERDNKVPPPYLMRGSINSMGRDATATVEDNGW